MSQPPLQVGPALLVQDSNSLRHLYFCVHAGVQKMRSDGMSSAHLEPLKALLRRAAMAADGHEHPVYVLAEQDCESQDDWMTVAEAADELELGVRQVRRLAADGLGTRKGREWILSRSKVLELKQQRDWKGRNGARHFPGVA